VLGWRGTCISQECQENIPLLSQHKADKYLGENMKIQRYVLNPVSKNDLIHVKSDIHVILWDYPMTKKLTETLLDNLSFFYFQI
jgi:hypothetical protein